MVTAAIPVRTTGIRKRYIGIGLLSILFAFVGFWPSYFGPVFVEAAAKQAILHVHATVFIGWLALFTAQAYFAATRRLDLHVRVGRVGIAYGALIIVIGLATGYIRGQGYAGGGDFARGSNTLYNAVIDMAVFTPFFLAAVLTRKKPELHKRLMIVAGTSLLVAAVFRMQFLGVPRNWWLAHAIWFSPILLMMLADFRQRRLIHPVFLIGLVVLTLQSPMFRPAIRETDAWQSTSRFFLGDPAARP